MIVSAHHVIYDGWSNALIFKELLYAYGEYLNGREPKSSKKTKYKELVKWYQNQDKQKQKLYWEDYLKGYKSKKAFWGRASRTIVIVWENLASTCINWMKKWKELSINLYSRNRLH